MREFDAFFSKPNVRNIFTTAAIKIQNIISEMPSDADPNTHYMLTLVGTTFFHIKSTPELFDQRCPLNIEGIGEHLVEVANHISGGNLQDQDFAFYACFRLLIEFQLASVGPVARDLLAVLDRVHDYKYDGNTYAQIRYAEHQMIINVLQRYIHHPKMTELKDLPETIDRAERQIKQADYDIDMRESRVNELKKTLDKYETAFNFVGLYDGFKQLRTQKRWEQGVGLLGLLALAVLMLCPFFIKFYLMLNLTKLDVDTATYISILGYELVVAYFFRVALHNYRGVKAQLIQIDLRMALCQFVQGYAKYAKDVHKESPQLLERFDQ